NGVAFQNHENPRVSADCGVVADQNPSEGGDGDGVGYDRDLEEGEWTEEHCYAGHAREGSPSRPRGVRRFAAARDAPRRWRGCRSRTSRSSSLRWWPSGALATARLWPIGIRFTLPKMPRSLPGASC